MARFRAYSSDSSDEESAPDNASNDDQNSENEQNASQSASSSDLDEHDLVMSSPTRPRKQDQKTIRADDSEEDGSSSEDLKDDTRLEPHRKGRPDSSSIIPWAQHVGVDAQKMHVMQTSLFRVPEESAALKALNTASRLPPRLAVTSKSQLLNRKHSRDSEGDSLRIDARKRTSFAHDMDPTPYRPSRKYARVDNSSSVAAENESARVDAGLARGRSFGIGWGPGGKLIYLGQLCSPFSTSRVSANSPTLQMTTIPLAATSHDHQISLSTKLLQHHLSNTPILPDQGVPIADPSSSLSFSSFGSLFPLADSSLEASIFRLGHALFDELDIHLPNNVSPDVRSRIIALRRKAALSEWLEHVVANSVDQDLKDKANTTIAKTFIHLTGNQVEKACDTAMSDGNVRLATLISQAGGDFQFREDLRSQLSIWQEQRIDAHIDDNVRKVYALLAGIIDEVVQGSKGTGIEKCSDVDVTEGLDWKRVFGLCLWYMEPINASISDVFQSYSSLLEQKHRKISEPQPLYSLLPEQSNRSPWHISDTPPPDALYSLIRLHSDPSLSLSHILDPLSFTSSPLDYTLCWHLYILLSRCMRIRDLADRQAPSSRRAQSVDDEEEAEEEDWQGHSQSADLLCSCYAFQLEKLGLIQEATFVLLHIEGPAGRRKAIKDLLARSASQLDEWITRGLVGSLKIPMDWVNEAKAIQAMSTGQYFQAYELYLAASMFNKAHEIAVLHLAPDAIVRRDLDILKSLFVIFEGKSIDGWYTRGQVFLDYVECMTRLPELIRSMTHDINSVPDAVEATELEELSRKVPRLIGILPDVLSDSTDPRHEAALAEMMRGLVQRLDRVKPLTLVNSRTAQHVDEATRLRHVRSGAFSKFIKDVEVAAAA